jgi:hypothetical protein
MAPKRNTTRRRSSHPDPSTVLTLASRRDLPIKPAEFLARNPVFRVEEFTRAHSDGTRSPRTISASLAYHVRQGHLFNPRRGLYTSTRGVDPWVLGSRLTPDAVIAYDGALSFHKLAGLGYGMSYLTEHRSAPFHYNEVAYTPVKVPLLRHGPDIEIRERAGQALRVTSLARTVVDVLDRLDLLHDPVDLLRTLVETRGLDFDAMLAHVKHLGRRVTAGRLGLYLCSHRDAPRSVLFALEHLIPTSATYFDRRQAGEGHHFFGRWEIGRAHV